MCYQRLRANEEPLCPDDIKNDKLKKYVCNFCGCVMILEYRFIEKNTKCPICKKGMLKEEDKKWLQKKKIKE